MPERIRNTAGDRGREPSVSRSKDLMLRETMRRDTPETNNFDFLRLFLAVGGAAVFEAKN